MQACSGGLLEMARVWHENSMTNWQYGEYKGTCTYICEQFIWYRKPDEHKKKLKKKIS